VHRPVEDECLHECAETFPVVEGDFQYRQEAQGGHQAMNALGAFARWIPARGSLKQRVGLRMAEATSTLFLRSVLGVFPSPQTAGSHDAGPLDPDGQSPDRGQDIAPALIKGSPRSLSDARHQFHRGREVLFSVQLRRLDLRVLQDRLGQVQA
jgi:hypothetical protein